MEAFGLVEKVFGVLIAALGLVTTVFQFIQTKRDAKKVGSTTVEGIPSSNTEEAVYLYRRSIKRLFWTIFSMTVIMGILIGAYYLAPVSIETTNRILKRLDGSLFSGTGAEIGRVYGDDTAVRTQGSLDTVLTDTKSTFDLAARHAASICSGLWPLTARCP